MFISSYRCWRCASCCCVATNCVFTKSICWVGNASSATWVGFRGAGALRRILSSESLLFALNSGCLNSHACAGQWDLHAGGVVRRGAMPTHPQPVRGLPALFVVVADFVEVVFVELAHEAGEIAVLEVFGQDGFGESLVLPGTSAGDFGSVAATSRERAPPARRSCPAHPPTARWMNRLDPPTSFRSISMGSATTTPPHRDARGRTCRVCGPEQRQSGPGGRGAGRRAEATHKVAGAVGAHGADSLTAIHGVVVAH